MQVQFEYGLLLRQYYTISPDRDAYQENWCNRRPENDVYVSVSYSFDRNPSCYEWLENYNTDARVTGIESFGHV